MTLKFFFATLLSLYTYIYTSVSLTFFLMFHVLQDDDEAIQLDESGKCRNKATQYLECIYALELCLNRDFTVGSSVYLSNKI